MRVVSMAILQMAFYLLGAIVILFARVSSWFVYLVYANGVVLLVILYLHVDYSRLR